MLTNTVDTPSAKVLDPNKIYDLIGIGLGPFNLSLACLSSEINDLDSLFVDQNERFDWHPGMMLESATLQTPFMSDLVTLADPTHPLSFLNYAKTSGRLYSFYIRESFFLQRKEYNQYCQWASQQLNNVSWNSQVTEITFNEDSKCYAIAVEQNNTKTVLTAKHVVFGTGPRVHVPKPFKSLLNFEQSNPAGNDSISNHLAIHSSDYLNGKKRLQQQPSITIVGGGQSAAEIYYDLLSEQDDFGYELNWVTRSSRFFPLEYTKLTLEMTSPDYVDYFFNLPDSKRKQLIQSQSNLYKGINSSLINDIFDLLYIKNLNGALNTNLITNSSVNDYKVKNGQVYLSCLQEENRQGFHIPVAGLVFATGYQYQTPEWMSGIEDCIQWENAPQLVSEGNQKETTPSNRIRKPKANRNYSIDKHNQLFVQNVEISTHGFVTPDLGMACYRNAHILNTISGRECYQLEQRIAFQHFAPPAEWLEEAESVDLPPGFASSNAKAKEEV